MAVKVKPAITKKLNDAGAAIKQTTGQVVTYVNKTAGSIKNSAKQAKESVTNLFGCSRSAIFSWMKKLSEDGEHGLPGRPG